MGKWMNTILAPPDEPDSTDHIAAEDMARLVDASIGDTERERLLHHINRCQRCYDILHDSLKDNPFTVSVRPVWWRARVVYALAACLILIFAVSGQQIYRHWSRDIGAVTATLELDQNLIDILLEDSALQIGRGARLNRLLAALQQRAIPVDTLNLAVLAKPYYQKKSLFGPKEFLHVRIENDVAYLEVKDKKTD